MLHNTSRWLVMLISFPPTSSRVRVGVWRQLKRLGAVSFKGGAWILPEREDTTERFQWLLQEIQSLGGDAALLHVDRIDPLSPEQVGEFFRRERTLEYEALRPTAEAMLTALGRKARATDESLKRLRAQAASVRREFDRVARIDYLRVPAGEELRRMLERIDMKLKAVDVGTPKTKARQKAGMPPLRSLWVTRPRPYIDRLASAWLIRRFYDPKARIAFAKDPSTVKKGIPFDVLGAEFGHHGEDCTYETLLKRLGLKERGLMAIAEVVHEADLQDGKYSRQETSGIEMTLKGLAATHADDQDLLDAGMAVFDGLYAALSARK